jgi:hypothetical protein
MNSSGELVGASTLHRLGLESTAGYVSNLLLPYTHSPALVSRSSSPTLSAWKQYVGMREDCTDAYCALISVSFDDRGLGNRTSGLPANVCTPYCTVYLSL